MSINFQQDINPEARAMMEEAFSVKAMDERTALLEGMNTVNQKKFKELANVANQPVTVELNSIGDRKEVGGIVYELDVCGWKKLPIGTTL